MTIPVAIKLSPYFSSIANMAKRLVDMAPTDSFSSIVSINRISIWKSWKLRRVWC